MIKSLNFVVSINFSLTIWRIERAIVLVKVSASHIGKLYIIQALVSYQALRIVKHSVLLTALVE
jgi:hypothetical protein